MFHREELSLQTAWTDILKLGAGPKWLSRAKVGSTPYDEIFQRGNLRFIKYRAPNDSHTSGPAPDVTLNSVTSDERVPVVIIPSLINRHYILDLLPGRSLVEEFVNQGFPTYLMAWGHPPAEDRYLTIEDLFKRRVFKAIEHAAAKSPSGKVHLVGQCLGGTLATKAALMRPELIQSLSLLTTPIDFENAGQLSLWAKAPGFDVDALVEAYGNVPATFLQTSFQFLKPSAPLTKITKLFEKRKDEDFLVNFLAMEMWSNDAISFPGLCYKFIIEDLYQRNVLKEQTKDAPFPIMDAMATDDHIVPPHTRLPYPNDLTQTLNLKGGHIGAVIGSKARKDFWPKWMEWLNEQAPTRTNKH